MRLHLDSSATNPTGTNPAEKAPVSLARSGESRSGSLGSAAGSGDSISVSGASSAFSALASDRATRIQQLSAAVKTGQYSVPSATLSTAIVAHAAS